MDAWFLTDVLLGFIILYFSKVRNLVTLKWLLEKGHQKDSSLHSIVPSNIEDSINSRVKMNNPSKNFYVLNVCLNCHESKASKSEENTHFHWKKLVKIKKKRLQG